MTRVRLLFTLVALLIAPLALANAQEGTPVAGEFSVTVTGSVRFNRVSTNACPPSDLFWGGLMTEGSGTGSSPTLGEIRVEFRHCTPAGEEQTDGAMAIYPSEGEEIWLDYSGRAPFPTDIGEVLPYEGEYTVVGGTGPFENATGEGSLKAEITFEGLPDPEWPATWTFEGTLIVPSGTPTAATPAG